jgi:hypothetical protein
MNSQDQSEMCNMIMNYLVIDEQKSSEDIEINHKAAYSVINFFDVGYLRLKSGKKKTFISVRETFKPLVLEHTQNFEFIKSDPLWIRILIDSKDDIKALFPLFLNLYRHAYNLLGSDFFSCCSRFLECSDEMTCIQSNARLAKGCIYRRNLDNGKIFYGKNSDSGIKYSINHNIVQKKEN